MNAPQKPGITVVEILVGLGLVFILLVFLLAIPRVTVGPVKSPVMQTLNNMRQLQMLTQTAALDNEIAGKPIRWTCSNNIPLTYAQWTNSLTNESITPLIIKKFLTVHDEGHFWDGGGTLENGIAVYAVTESDPGDTLLLATKNWHGPGTHLSGEPYENRCFLVARKSGEVVSLPANKAQDTNIIGSGGMYHYLPLK